MSEGPVGDEGGAVTRERRMLSRMGRIFHMREETLRGVLNEGAVAHEKEVQSRCGFRGFAYKAAQRRASRTRKENAFAQENEAPSRTEKSYVAHERRVLMRMIDSGSTEEGRYCRVRNKRRSRGREDALSHMGKRAPSRMIEWAMSPWKGIVAHEKESFIAHKEYHRTRARNVKSDVKGAVVHDRGANVHEKGVIALSGTP
ncbi:hypothetical protein B0H14DRAFT_2580129 [Mycena olivaceomarginata]|nr:hypothetical protein B0H14DRAFT_2580129 [Mycena olivaceomarginata]